MQYLYLTPLLLFGVFANKNNIESTEEHYDWITRTAVTKSAHNMTLCRTLRGNEDCEKFLPLEKETRQLPDLYPNVKYSIRLEEPRQRRLGKGSMFVPYRCHILRKNEQPTHDNAFIFNGDSVKDTVGILFKPGSAARIELVLQDLLYIEEDTPYYWYSGLFHIHCDLIECCTRLSKDCTKDDKCPDFRQTEFHWQPDVSNLVRAQLKGEFRVLPWTDNTSAFRRALFQRYRDNMNILRVRNDGKQQGQRKRLA